MRAAALAIAAVAVLAGCLGGGGGGKGSGDGGTGTGAPTSTGSSSSSTPTGPPPAPQVLDLLLAFELTGCRGATVQVSRPLEDVQALLPDGFTAAPPPGSATGAGVLAYDLLRCDQFTTAAGIVVPDAFVGLAYTSIERPSGRVPGAPDAPVQQYLFRVLANDTSVLATVWPAAGYDTYLGATTVETVEGTQPASIGLAACGAYNVVAPGAVLDALAAPRTQAFARYTVLGDGSVLQWTGTDDLPVLASGAAAIQLPKDDPFARYAPPERPALAGAGTQVLDGAVHLQDLVRIFPRAA